MSFFYLFWTGVIDCINKWYKTDGGYVVMSDGAQINISRSRKDAFFDLMQKL